MSNLTCTSSVCCRIASSFSLISSSTEIFSLGVQQRRQKWLATEDRQVKLCSPTPPSHSQVSAEGAAPRFSNTATSAPWTTMVLSPNHNFTEQRAAQKSRAKAAAWRCVRSNTWDFQEARCRNRSERKCFRKGACAWTVKCVGSEEWEADGYMRMEEGGERGEMSHEELRYSIYHLCFPGCSSILCCYFYQEWEIRDGWCVVRKFRSFCTNLICFLWYLQTNMCIFKAGSLKRISTIMINTKKKHYKLTTLNLTAWNTSICQTNRTTCLTLSRHVVCHKIWKIRTDT